jgi:quercetin 2,3-dioxygenase
MTSQVILGVKEFEMNVIRRSNERGYADHGWLQSFHSFSFADYHDPQHMHFGPLRVINEDHVAPGQGFGTHGHQDMEIITYVLEGAVAHHDSLGNGSTIRPGDVQRMSAGRGVRHSEFNPSPNEATHLLQIWIIPNVRDIDPSYEEKQFSAADKRGQLRLIAAPDARDGSVLIHQNARVYAGLFDGAEQAQLSIAADRCVYVHVARGRLTANQQVLSSGDALQITAATSLTLTAGEQAEVLVFDLPA